ncbi:hypothetical protein ACF1CG_34790 [Streptomyces sp. NPDC014773]|uniref:hypothetical protein n=1 Tax=Streptomyces sp. NPDC014773 TaxID=3364908 RepID=UPI003702A12E
MTAPATIHEERLVGLVQELAGLQEQHLGERPCRAHQTCEHLLLALGRLFTFDPRSHRPIGMPDHRCYENAALYASETPGLMYTEGVALVSTGEGRHICLSHAWAARPDRTAIEPTWDEPGRAYFGLSIADPVLWPLNGDGLLGAFDKTLPLLRDGLPTGVLGAVGRRPARS